MIFPPMHPKEEDRLRIVSETGLVNNSEESEYDKFVKIASYIADVPIAIFSIVGLDTQWFRAKIGIDAFETPKNVSFCGHAIVNPDEPLLVEDALFDMRFCDNPLVINDPGIRFYAGFPICHSKENLPIGTICVIDRKPRILDQRQIEALKDLGKLMESHLNSSVKIRRLNEINSNMHIPVKSGSRSVFKK